VTLRARLGLLIAGGLASLVPGAALAEAHFQGLGFLPDKFPTTQAYGVSGDGGVVAGLGSAAPRSAFRWTEAGGIEDLGSLGGTFFRSDAWDVSEDGATVVGSSLGPDGVEAYVWTEAGGMVGLGDLPGGDFSSSALGISADGSVVVGAAAGLQNFEAFRWTQATGMVGLGDLPGGIASSQADGVSADGAVVVGYGSSPEGFEAFRWTEADGMVGLGDLPGGFFSSDATAASADGSVVVGFSRSAEGFEAFRWTEAEGMVGLGDLPGGSFSSKAHGVSADGSVIVGEGSQGPGGGATPGTTAVVWTAADGPRSLKEILEVDFGLDLGDWHLVQALDVSGDGRSIVGWGTNPDGLDEAWLARLLPDVIPVAIDIRPGNAVNPIQPFSRSVVPVAIWGAADFDVAAIDLGSLAFGPNGAGPAEVGWESVRDRNGDGLDDLVVPFRSDESGIEPGQGEACVTGKTLDGVPFEGCDSIRTIGRP
jgi:probable HAF family extracellular repeat protein